MRVSDFLKHVLKFFGLLVSVPFSVSFVSAWQEALGFILFLFAVPLLPLTLIFGSIIWFVRGIIFAKEVEVLGSRVVVIFATPLLLLCTIVLSWPSLFAGQYLGTMSRLFVNYGHYEKIVASAKVRKRAAWYADDDGVTYSVDVGPPVRVAFNPAGFLDNWSGIIYDPTGDVMLADGFNPVTGKFLAPDRVTKLFDGDLVECGHLWGNYYRCSFT